MKLKIQSPGRVFVLFLLFPTFFCGTSPAQDVIAPPPPSNNTEPVWQQNQPNPFQVFQPAGNSPIAPQQPFQIGPVTARPHVFYQLLYATGLQSSLGNHQDSVINTISPGITFDIGTHWALDYTPTLQYYSNSQLNNELNHIVSLTWAADYEDWNFGFSQSYARSSSVTAETGGQTEQENYSTALSASYAFNSKISLDTSFNQNISFADNSSTLAVFLGTNFLRTISQTFSQDTYDWSTMEWVNYEFWPRLNAGIGAGMGYTAANIGPDQLYEDLQGRVNWRATDKVSFSLNAGFEERQLLDGSGDLLNPIFGVSIQYQPFDNTQISLTASRTISSSPLFGADAVTETTGVNLNISQRLLEKFQLSLGGGYSHAKYSNPIETSAGTREDDLYSFSARFSRSFLKRGTASILYQYSDDRSSTSGFSYSSNQIGFELGYAY